MRTQNLLLTSKLNVNFTVIRTLSFEAINKSVLRETLFNDIVLILTLFHNHYHSLFHAHFTLQTKEI